MGFPGVKKNMGLPINHLQVSNWWPILQVLGPPRNLVHLVHGLYVTYSYMWYLGVIANPLQPKPLIRTAPMPPSLQLQPPTRKLPSSDRRKCGSPRSPSCSIPTSTSLPGDNRHRSPRARGCHEGLNGWMNGFPTANLGEKGKPKWEKTKDER